MGLLDVVADHEVVRAQRLAGRLDSGNVRIGLMDLSERLWRPGRTVMRAVKRLSCRSCEPS